MQPSKTAATRRRFVWSLGAAAACSGHARWVDDFFNARSWIGAAVPLVLRCSTRSHSLRYSTNSQNVAQRMRKGALHAVCRPLHVRSGRFMHRCSAVNCPAVSLIERKFMPQSHSMRLSTHWRGFPYPSPSRSRASLVRLSASPECLNISAPVFFFPLAPPPDLHFSCQLCHEKSHLPRLTPRTLILSAIPASDSEGIRSRYT